jgi:hypothetical protein
MDSLTPEERSALARKAAAASAAVRSAKKAARLLTPRPKLVTPVAPVAPKQTETASDSRPLTRKQGLNVAADVIQSLRGYRKNPDYRTMQSDLNFVCEVLQRASAGETKDIGRPTASE